jgi:peptide/nickel transport system permease protein
MRLLIALAIRLAYAAILVVAVIVLNFLLIRLAPGDPVETIAGAMGGMTEELRAQLVQAYGLDLSLPQQLLRYLERMLSGDLGYSYFFNLPVSGLILERVPQTVLLVVVAVAVSLLAGTALGVLASRRPNGWFSQSLTVLSVVGYAAPVFWTGIMLIIVFAAWLPLFPVSGMDDIANAGNGWFAYALDVAHHLVLPVATLSIIYVAQYSNLARASMLDVLGADYIRTARAKGLSEGSVYFKHALKNAILPVVTVAGLQFGNLLAGAILVETVFNWPGLGRLAFESILRRDHPTILGILFCSACMVIIANLLTDLVYRAIDPRIRTVGN